MMKAIQKTVSMKLITVALLSTAVVFLWYSSAHQDSDFMAIDEVSIKGDFVHLQLGELQENVNSALAGGFFTVNLSNIRNNLLTLPWVETVSVRRQWPSRLSITVYEKKPVAYWGEVSLLSNNGESFTPKVLPKDLELPMLIGPEGLHQNIWEFMNEINPQFSVLNLSIKKLALDNRRSWQVEFSNNLRLLIGRSNIREKVKKFIWVFSAKNAPEIQGIAVIDLRYPNGFAMRYRNQG